MINCAITCARQVTVTGSSTIEDLMERYPYSSVASEVGKLGD